MLDQQDILQSLKQELAAESQQEQADINRILSLSNQIAKLDPDNVRFSVDAGIINRLGRELVGRHETAVSELVKNAYDADATQVTLEFTNAYDSGGTLKIEDNGLGMTREQLINGFMRLSSADKIHNPVSERYKRIRAGKKGIGRFATQRLGNTLTIITQTLDNPRALKVSINWDDFQTDKDLLLVTNQIQQIDKQQEEGTILIIGDLREGWSDAMIKRIYRYTSELLQPFPLSKTKKEESEQRVDPGFQSAYYRDINGERTAIIDEQTAFYQHALANIEGYVLEDGQGCWSLKSEKLDFPEETFLIGKDRDESQTPFNVIKNVHFFAYYFIYDAPLMPPQTMSFIREVAHEKGGIRIYRNGFRVLPYGEKLNDWLGMDESSAKRVILSAHRNINFFGFVEITDTSGVYFDETSSREGLIENDAMKELVDFVSRCLISAVIKVAELRGRKGTSSQDWTATAAINLSEQVDDVITELSTLVEMDEERGVARSENFNSGKFKEVFERLVETRAEEKKIYEDQRRSMISEIEMLRILAGLGLVIGQFVHEVKRFLPAFDADINYLKKALKQYAEHLETVNRLGNNLKSFTSYTAYFDKAISQNVLRDLISIDLIDAVNDFEDVIKGDIRRLDIEFPQPVFDKTDLYTVPMHPSEWASILFNLYTNSRKAIRRHKVVPGKVFIHCGRVGDNVFLEFSDTGDGISKENEPLIFNAFFTTSSAAGRTADENDALTGTGLGLKIIKDIIESYGGKIFVTPPSAGYNTTLRIEIPAKTS